MKLENLGCKYIKISSDSFEQGYISQTLKELQVSALYNNTNLVTKNIDLTNLIYQQSVTMEFPTGTFITQIYAKNIYSDKLIPLLSGTEATEITQESLTNVIIPMIETNLASLGTPVVSASLADGTLAIEITGLLDSVVMDSIVTSLLGSENTTYFTVFSESGIIINNNTIILSPEFFDLSAFVEGIYNITIVLTTTANVSIEDQTCLFLDCTMSSLLAAFVEPLECDQDQMNLLLMHYSLVQSSNNTCNCDKMYNIYKYIADSITNQSIENCGCQ